MAKVGSHFEKLMYLIKMLQDAVFFPDQLEITTDEIPFVRSESHNLQLIFQFCFKLIKIIKIGVTFPPSQAYNSIVTLF